MAKTNTWASTAPSAYRWVNLTSMWSRAMNVVKMRPEEEEMNEMDLENLNDMTDEELQEAFAAGRIKPGLNIFTEAKSFKNNVDGLKRKLEEFTLNLNWIEKLDLIIPPAPMPPEAQYEIMKEKTADIAKLRNRVRTDGSKDVMDDFKREMLFHRQAQAAVIEGIKRLKSLGIPTKRPDDYFAEMAKSDEHMHKVRKNLAARQEAAVRAEKISNLRRLKKLGKQAQVENKLKQVSEKKKMLNEVKKFKKGLRKDLSFLDNKKDKKSGKMSAKAVNKRAFKNEKFGFGGKKRGSKRNTKESAAYMGSLTKKAKKSGARSNKRLGKSKRIKKKSRK